MMAHTVKRVGVPPHNDNRAGNNTSLDEPLSGTGPEAVTFLNGISGSQLVGSYSDTNLVSHGFLATLLPPPKLEVIGLNQRASALLNP